MNEHMPTKRLSILLEEPHLVASGRGRKKKSPPTGNSPRPATPIDLKDVKVLVVDDDAASAKLVSVVLGGEGCDVKTAGSAEDALAILQSFEPRVIVVDLVLPLMSGLLFAQRLKADPAMRNIVLIAVTAFNGPEAERVARGTGFAAYVRKPIDPISFTGRVAEQLGGVE
jgi:CheY-like chemotaxis protein